MTRQELSVLQVQLTQKSANFNSQFRFFYGKLQMADKSIWRLDDILSAAIVREDAERIRKCLVPMQREVISYTKDILATVKEFEEKI